MIAQAIVVVSPFQSYCFAGYRTLFPYKATWGSSLARCCRLAVAPTFFMQFVFAGALTNYCVTGINMEGVVQAGSLGVYHSE